MNGPGRVILVGARRLRQQELGVALLHRAAPSDRADDARHRGRAAAAAPDMAGALGVDAVERQGKAVRIALAADLAIADDVDAGVFHLAYRNDRRVILGLLAPWFLDPPDVAGVDAGHAVMFQEAPIDQPVGLRVAADDGGRDQMARIGHRGAPAAGWRLPVHSAESVACTERPVPSLVPR